MNSKLTLTLEKDVIEVAKTYAKEEGISLSEMVENYFRLLTADKRQIKPRQLSPKVQKLRGIIHSEHPIDFKKVLEEELIKKYDL